MKSETSYEVQFNKWLDPFKAMLAQKKKRMQPNEWLEMVERTKNSIIQNPEQYLGRDLPVSTVIHETVTIIFADFLQKQEEK
jgi:hypothetical protein